MVRLNTEIHLLSRTLVEALVLSVALRPIRFIGMKRSPISFDKAICGESLQPNLSGRGTGSPSSSMIRSALVVGQGPGRSV